MLLGKIAGIRIRIHPLTLLFVPGYIYLGLGLEILMIFTAVLLHELAHGVLALLNGIHVDEVELFPFGGQARLDDFTGLVPEREIYVALAGPLFSLTLAGIFYFLPANSLTHLDMLYKVNLYLGLFNLLPGLPLDGGRVLRAILSKNQGFKKATTRTAMLGKLLALFIGLWGGYLFYSSQNGMNALVVAVLLYWAARREASLLNYAFMRYLIHKQGELRTRGILPGKQVICSGETLLKDVLDWTRPSFYLLVVMVNEEQQVVAMYTEAELIECFFNKGPRSRLSDV